ncbi:tumor necrosis factor receptor superfamily member 13C-like [Scomber japonicus]|uniref:tumor necrosis factor receptor superfamily member 13C-like n=1 Tax=Scomber japonicus TaxID=13676 RepID=UPI0023050422|nr:tumor necrosis factor receptor superfamily member 13C-like [Scomber japonicus]
MAKKDCPAGRKWDHLVNVCVSSTAKTTSEPKPSTDLNPAVIVQQRPTTAAVQANPVMMLSPALWIFVGLATVGSIVALVLWFVIYRQQTRNSSTSEDAEPGQEPLQKTEPPIKICPLPSERNCQAETLQRAAGNPAPCAHLHLGDQTSSKWEEGFTACRGPAKHAGTEGVGGLLTCSTMREHRIPLPATELGGTALVTTKTV